MENIENQDFFIEITESDLIENSRLDTYLVSKLPQFSRSVIKNIFKKGNITTSSNIKLELKKMPPLGVKIHIVPPEPVPCTAKAEDIELEIIYEDQYLVFVNKPAGMVTHPAPGNYTGTLVNAILHHCPDLKGIGDQKRPGIVHRLDKGTSGVMVIAKTQKCHEGLVNLFSKHDIERRYETIVLGRKISGHGTIESSIGRHPNNRLKMAANVRKGKKAITHYKVLKFYEKFTHMEVTLETGRTHQIRVHLSSMLRKPILCDPLYGNPKQDLIRLDGSYKDILKDYPHPLLHAKSLGLKHPITNEDLYFEVEPPEVFRNFIKEANKELEANNELLTKK